jgi:hypothetical protein
VGTLTSVSLYNLLHFLKRDVQKSITLSEQEKEKSIKESKKKKKHYENYGFFNLLSLPAEGRLRVAPFGCA